MKTKLTLIASTFALIFATSAGATNSGNSNNSGNGGQGGAGGAGGSGFGLGIGIGQGGTASSKSAANSSSSSRSAANALSASGVTSSNTNIAKGGAGGSASAQGGTGGSSYSQGGTSSAQGGAAYSQSGSSSAQVNFNTPARQTVRQEGDLTIRNTPDVNLFTPPPTAPCTVTFGASGSGPGFGLGFSGFKEDEGCTVREYRRVAADNPAITRAADEYILKDIEAKMEKLRKQQRSVFSNPNAGGFGY
jgi:hypothetical protein